MARLADGGQSEVFLAARSGPHGFFRPVVIKALPDDFKGDRRLEALFYQEATLSSRFAHPHVISVHDAKRAEGEHFMVMDYVAGQTVADLAQRAFSQGDGITFLETLLIISDACRGLEYVHSFEDVDRRHFSIVHCDISPQNLMVTYDGVIQVFDFGISQVVGESSLGAADLVGGKFSYMSPEQCREEELDVRSDIFSLGVILYELAAGTRLFRATDQEEVAEAIISEPVAPPSEVAGHLDESFDDVVMQALRKDPDDRYQSARDFRRGIEELVDGGAQRLDERREALGEKTDRLFEDQREELAETLNTARQRLSEQVFAPESPGDGDVDEGPTEREQELEQQIDEAREKIDDLRQNAERATEVASALSYEVTELQQRQRWFIAGICALTLVALAIATMAYLSHEGTFVGEAESAPAETTVITPGEDSASSD